MRVCNKHECKIKHLHMINTSKSSFINTNLNQQQSYYSNQQSIRPSLLENTNNIINTNQYRLNDRFVNEQKNMVNMINKIFENQNKSNDKKVNPRE